MGGCPDDSLKVCLDIIGQLGCSFPRVRAAQLLKASIALDTTRRIHFSKIDSLAKKGFISDPRTLELISLLEQGASTALQAKNKAMVTYMNHLMYSKDPVDHEKFKSEIQLFLASKPDLGSNFYNSVAWQLYEMTDDRALLTKAAEWAQVSIDGEKNSYNTDTMAAILFKLGKVEKAKSFALESIELAKKEGNDYSATEDLLKKMEAVK